MEPDPLREAPSRLARIRQAAATYASVRRLTVPDATASLPLAERGPEGSAWVCMLSRREFDLDAGDHLLYEPELKVRVDPQTMRVIGHESWRSLDDPALQRPLCAAAPGPAARLPDADRAALAAELHLLAEALLGLAGKPSLAPAERAQVLRFDQLFRFLIPAELFPAYRRLSPSFFDWLAGHTGSPDLVQLEASPAVDPAIIPPPVIIPAGRQAVAWALLVPPTLAPPPYRIDHATLATAVSQVGLRPAGCSPLAWTSPAERRNAATAGEAALPWLTPEWQAALKVLADPAREIVQVCGSDRFASLSTLYTGGSADSRLWVRYVAGKEESGILFPEDPLRLRDLLLGVLDAERIRWAEQAVHAMRPEELIVVLALADWRAAQTDQRKDPPLEAIQALAAEPPRAGPLRWSAIAQVVSPVPLPRDAEAVNRGRALLGERRLLAGVDGALRPDPRLRAFLRLLGRPRAYGGLQVSDVEAADRLTVSGVAAVRTDQQLWLWEPTRETGAPPPPGAPMIRLFPVTGRQLAAVLNAFLQL